jgi:MoaA/NifB/PqqE/SkfB family radical SAM enzyme
MIRIVNWLLTRRCNLNCEYCAIVKDYDGMPEDYKPIKTLIKNEMTLPYILGGLERFKHHNPDCFHIFYGGEPLVRKDLPEIIKYCNKRDIHYTIISNNTDQIRPMIDRLFEKVDHVKGFTASVDPSFNEEQTDDRIKKSIAGFENLVALKEKVNDVVAEITVMKHNVEYLLPLVKMLTDHGISSDITFIDIAKSPYYDFSNITDESMLVEPSPKLGEIFQLISDSNLDVHMKNVLLPMIYNILPSNMDCELEKEIHNVTVDADGSIRLCLRIRGTHAPKLLKIPNLFNDDMNVSFIAEKAISKDKKVHCLGCNHTCLLMSKYINDTEKGSDDLIHLDRRA